MSLAGEGERRGCQAEGKRQWDPAICKGRGSQDSHTGNVTPLRVQGRDSRRHEMGAVTSSKCSASWNLTLLICKTGIRKSVFIPILQMSKLIRSRPSGFRAHMLSHNTMVLLQQMRCESSLQTLLSVSRVAMKNTPREVGSPHRRSLQRAPDDSLVLVYKNPIS